jgi:hypothetical protein
MCKPEKIPAYIHTNFVLHAIMEQQPKFKALVKEADKALTPVGVKDCFSCKDKPLDCETRCERTIRVHSRDTSMLKDKILYAFDDPASLPFRVCAQYWLIKKLILLQKARKKKTKNPKEKPIRAGIHVDDLPYPGIEHHIHCRTNLDSKCPRDITHFVDAETDHEIGGVIHNGLPTKFFNIVKSHHDHFFGQGVNVKRGNAFQQVDHGIMASAGFNEPGGGVVGNGYGNPAKPTRICSDAIIDKAAADRYVQNLFRTAVVKYFMLLTLV